MTRHDIVITRPARPDERDGIAQLVAEAFTPLPPTKWLLPNRHERAIRFPVYMQIWVDHGLAAGTIDIAETPGGGVVGAAIWWREPAAEPADYTTRMVHAVGEQHVARFKNFDAAMHQVHPQQEHLYLGFAAVHPDQQRRGLGSVLLRRRHDDLDTCKVPAYLVAASADARRLYLRHGYRDHGPPISLPDGPSMQPMMRHPANGS